MISITNWSSAIPPNSVQSLVPCVWTKGRTTSWKTWIMPTWRRLTDHPLHKSAASFHLILRKSQATLHGQSLGPSDYTCCTFLKLNPQLYVPYVLSFLRLVPHNAQTELSPKLSLVPLKPVMLRMSSELQLAPKYKIDEPVFFSYTKSTQYPNYISVTTNITLSEHTESVPSLLYVHTVAESGEIKKLHCKRRTSFWGH